MDQSLTGFWIGSKELEQLLITINEVPDEDQPALTSRLKLLARLGVPHGDRVGTGRRAQYDLVNVFQVAIAIEMIQLSVSTEKAARLLTYAWPLGLSNIIPTIGRLRHGRDSEESDYPAVITLSLERFDGLTKADDPKVVDDERRAQSLDRRFTPIVGYGPFLRAIGRSGYFDLSAPMKSKRIALINASGLAERIGLHLDAAGLLMLEDLYRWCRRFPYVRPYADILDAGPASATS